MSPSAAPVRRSGSTARRSARYRGAVMTRNGSPPIPSHLARQYGRYGYRKIAGLLEQAGWLVNDKRVERIWRREGLKVPHKQPKRGRLWLADGSCIRLRPEHRNHVWSYDFVEDRTHDGRKYRMLNVIDEFTHECLAIRVARKLKAIDVIDVLSDLFILRGVPGHIRSDNGPEFVAKAVQEWITAVGAKTAYIAPGSPWENGYVESFNARLRDELLDGEIFYTLREAQIVIESWRRHFNTIRPHESLGYKPPAPEVFVPAFAAWPAALRCFVAKEMRDEAVSRFMKGDGNNYGNCPDRRQVNRIRAHCLDPLVISLNIGLKPCNFQPMARTARSQGLRDDSMLASWAVLCETQPLS